MVKVYGCPPENVVKVVNGGERSSYSFLRKYIAFFIIAIKCNIFFQKKIDIERHYFLTDPRAPLWTFIALIHALLHLFMPYCI